MTPPADAPLFIVARDAFTHALVTTTSLGAAVAAAATVAALLLFRRLAA